MWGWSPPFYENKNGKAVFPMYVGVILYWKYRFNRLLCIPHVCGGDPWLKRQWPTHRAYSPCMWGWSLRAQTTKLTRIVFPMYVGVILLKEAKSIGGVGIPHVCGGDPIQQPTQRKKRTYSPCMWGWSSSSTYAECIYIVFPMYVGVILLSKVLISMKIGIPHVCGGDPISQGCW